MPKLTDSQLVILSAAARRLDPVLVSIKFGNVTDGLRVVRAWFLIAVPLGFTVLMVRLVQSILRDLSDLRAGRPVFTGRKLFD